MRPWPLHISATLATCLTGCGIAAKVASPPGPAFPAGHTPTEQEIGLVEQNSGRLMALGRSKEDQQQHGVLSAPA